MMRSLIYLYVLTVEKPNHYVCLHINNRKNPNLPKIAKHLISVSDLSLTNKINPNSLNLIKIDKYKNRK